MGVRMMNPMMNPMMMNPMMSQMMRGSGYGPVQFPQLPNQLQLARAEETEEAVNQDIDDAVAHYPSMMWGQQPMLYPMMMMMPMSSNHSGQESSSARMMMQCNPPPPDLVHDRDHPHHPHLPQDGPDTTPDVVRASEPTYMNDQTPGQVRKLTGPADFFKAEPLQEPSYANTNIMKDRAEEESKARLEGKKRWEEEMFDTRRPLRAQSVQPVLPQENLTGKANFHAKRFNTSYKSPRSER